MKKSKEKVSGKRLAIQILAIILAVLMVVGIAYYTIYMIVEAGKKKAAENEKEKQEQTDTSTNGQSHSTSDNTDSGANDNTLPDDAADDIFD